MLPYFDNNQNVIYRLPSSLVEKYMGITYLTTEEFIYNLLILACMLEVCYRKGVSTEVRDMHFSNHYNVLFEHYMVAIHEDDELSDDQKLSCEMELESDIEMIGDLYHELHEFMFIDNDHFDDLLYCRFCVNHVSSGSYMYLSFIEQDDGDQGVWDDCYT